METATTTPAMLCSPESLPRSLRHLSDKDALYGAALLVEFLQSAIARCMESKDTASDNEIMGMDKCFDLLRDKIEIGAGIYDFPQMGYDTDQKLCIRREV